MTRTFASHALGTVAVALLVAALGGCSTTEGPFTRPSARSSASPSPTATTVKEADPCSFLPKSQVRKGKFQRVGKDVSETSRSCTWKSAKSALMILVRWDTNTLVDFAQAFPEPVKDDVRLGGVNVILGRSDVRPACAGVFFAEQGTVVEVVVGDEPPSTADAACGRVKSIGTSTVREIRRQDLLRTP